MNKYLRKIWDYVKSKLSIALVPTFTSQNHDITRQFLISISDEVLKRALRITVEDKLV